jgi:hypothetical protein
MIDKTVQPLYKELRVDVTTLKNLKIHFRVVQQLAERGYFFVA